MHKKRAFVKTQNAMANKVKQSIHNIAPDCTGAMTFDAQPKH